MSKQKAKRQKLDAELVNLKKTLELIVNKQEQMHALLINNSKSIKKDTKKDIKNDWSRRLRIKY
jgi:signal transduction histidine kinase